MDLHELIKENSIGFYFQNEKVDLTDFITDAFNAKVYIKYPIVFMIELAEHLSLQPKEYLTIRGTKLEEFLQTADHVEDMVDFVLTTYAKAKERDKDIHICVAADLFKINFENVNYKEMCKLKGLNVSSWGRELLPFEKYWNIALCDNLMDALESYNPPATPEEFEEASVANAEVSLIGTPAQLKRYLTAAEKYPAYKKEIIKAVQGFIVDSPN